MFDSLFGNDDDAGGFTSLDSGQVTHTKNRLRSMADEMDLPPIPRDPGVFAGLLNQGATCYLNSLFQCIFFCPEMRHFFYSLDLDKYSAYEKGSRAYNIIRKFQLFFAKLKYMDFKNQTTEELTKAFGWDGGEGSQQQDVAEAMREIFDTLEKCFFEAGKTEEFTDVFKGTTVNYIKCLDYDYVSETSQPYYDLMLQIVNFGQANCKSVDESLTRMTELELMDGPNQYFCEPLGKKVDAYRGMKLGRLPDVLIMSLCRFSLDYTTWERKKINDQYDFDLRMNMRQYTQSDEDQFFDLFGVIVHRGDAYGGHYHAIIRDTLEECGNLKEFFESLGQEGLKDLNQDRQPRQWYEGHAKELPGEHAQALRKMFKLTGGAGKEDGAADGSEAARKAEEEECPDPFPTKVERNAETEYLFNNWYDFDDSRVKKFDVNRLHKYFGPSKETAYILFYRKTAQHAKKDAFAALTPPPSIYAEVLQINEEKKRQKLEYEKNKFKVNLNVGLVDDVYDFERDALLEGRDAGRCFDLLVSKYDSVATFREQIRGLFGISASESFLMVMYERSADNSTLDLTQAIVMDAGADGWNQLQDLNLFHKTSWFVIGYRDPRLKTLGERLSIKNTKYNVLLKVGERTESLVLPKFLSDEELVACFQRFAEWELKSQDIFVSSHQEFIPLLEVPAVERSMGIPCDSFTFLIKQTVYEPSLSKIVWPAQGSLNFVEQEGSSMKTVLLYVAESLESDAAPTAPLKVAMDYDMLLDEMLDLIKAKYDIPKDNARRIRNLFDNRLYSREDMQRSLHQLGYCEGGQRLRFERGRIPQANALDVNVKYSVIEGDRKTTRTENFVVELNRPVSFYWQDICAAFGLDPEQHHLYEANWHGDPSGRVRSLETSIEDLGVKQGDNWVIMHESLGVSQDMITYNIYFSRTGLPDCQSRIGQFKIHQNKSIKNLLQQIFELAQSVKHEESMRGAPDSFTVDNLLLREITANNLFGKVLNHVPKSLKNNKLKCAGLAFSVLPEPVVTSGSDLRLYVRKRDKPNDTYGPHQELLFLGGDKGERKYSLKDLQETIFALEGLTAQEIEDSDIALIRHHPNRYKWLIMTDFTEDLRKRPYFFSDGNTIGYWIHPKGQTPDDDWQDKVDREYAAALAASAETIGRVKGNDTASFKIKLND